MSFLSLTYSVLALAALLIYGAPLWRMLGSL